MGQHSEFIRGTKIRQETQISEAEVLMVGIYSIPSGTVGDFSRLCLLSFVPHDSET